MDKEELLKIKYGLIAVSQSPEDKKDGKLKVLHFCGYECPPNDDDMESLKKELNADPEFNLVGRIDKDVFIINATEEIVKRCLNIV
jgi:hypothetical protein